MKLPNDFPIRIGNALYMELILRAFREHEIERVVLEEARSYGLEYTTYADLLKWAHGGPHSEEGHELHEFAHEVILFDNTRKAIKARQEARRN